MAHYATSLFLWMYYEGVFPLGIAMPYELLYSRTIAGDGVVRYTDVPITDKSVMIEVLSLLSPFRRIAGYAYALRSDGITDYERSGGVMLPFGKNRVTFASATLPYGLEFFPKWGMKTGIISVYIGEPAPLPPPSSAWKQAPAGPYQMRLNASPAGVSYRTSPADEAIASVLNGAVAAVMIGEYVYWRIADGTVQLTQIGGFYPVYVSTEADYQNALLNPASVVL